MNVNTVGKPVGTFFFLEQCVHNVYQPITLHRITVNTKRDDDKNIHKFHPLALLIFFSPFLLKKAFNKIIFLMSSCIIHK